MYLGQRVDYSCLLSVQESEQDAFEIKCWLCADSMDMIFSAFYLKQACPLPWMFIHTKCYKVHEQICMEHRILEIKGIMTKDDCE